MKLNFKISEFNISGEPIPEAVADKILIYHIKPMQDVREEMNIPVFPSLKSAYRSEEWEKENERSGTSEHVFRGKGATDWTCEDFQLNKDRFLTLIIKYTNYTRIAIYNGFIHCDYQKTPSGKREIYESTASSEWTLIKTM